MFINDKNKTAEHRMVQNESGTSFNFIIFMFVTALCKTT